jgi:EthD domain
MLALPQISITTDYAARDASIAINSYTTVLRRPRVPHELFATYWRDVHGPLCARIPGLGWYVQHHLDREQDAHLWPAIDGIAPFPDYTLDGGVEIGFATAEDQAAFNAASHLLFADEQNMFAATVAYALPRGSRTLVDRLPNAIPNADDGIDRIHVHFGAAGSDAAAFGDFMRGFAEALAADPAVLKLRLHLPERYDNAEPAPPAPNVDHSVPPERALIAVIEIAFETPMTRRAFFESDVFVATRDGQKTHVAHVSAFAVSGVYTYVRDGQLTLAGLRGSRQAQLIERLGANNQVAADVRRLMLTGSI